ncbi:predicted protein [Chaetomium globosum CBS 148.51]|uniref:Uncharacterized protein n=1 Tax=Chaetomium globosum (strain ATCC 6205 / CBS 148.51 / DSM 1962 / NBRC 6347 / NRRL 1970) TaxID=306901 RepID=Q2H010_CHAGB|nr:uncharacterized protein CHGG_04886 [Chaetomium globosum CBS 148.51]EAQ88267.1 predicted protein [Chaetomium globosum CBS 148.51]
MTAEREKKATTQKAENELNICSGPRKLGRRRQTRQMHLASSMGLPSMEPWMVDGGGSARPSSADGCRSTADEPLPNTPNIPLRGPFEEGELNHSAGTWRQLERAQQLGAALPATRVSVLAPAKAQQRRWVSNICQLQEERSGSPQYQMRGRIRCVCAAMERAGCGKSGSMESEQQRGTRARRAPELESLVRAEFIPINPLTRHQLPMYPHRAAAQ